MRRILFSANLDLAATAATARVDARRRSMIMQRARIPTFAAMAGYAAETQIESALTAPTK